MVANPINYFSGNQPDLNPVKNFWSIHEKIMKSKERVSATIQELETNLKSAWSKIISEMLSNLVLSMPDCISAVLKAKGNCVLRNKFKSYVFCFVSFRISFDSGLLRHPMVPLALFNTHNGFELGGIW
jgi:hypothetical protein